ncbi:MAG: hypothetical protein KF866_10515 [Phycisphaeraceae bacterium]|nr:hypothetical protein [Phycisphaeraceae bacterium]MCW5754933.1 hypothetical protein [Phycisphaeraceae bacterium]
MCALGLAASVSVGQVRFLGTDNEILHRADSNGNYLGAVTLADGIVGMTVVPAGVALTGTSAGDIIAISSAQDGSNRYPLYRLDNPFGAATLTQIGSIDRNLTSLTWKAGRLYGTNPLGAIREVNLATLDTGPADFAGPPSAGFGGMQYDSVNDRFILLTANDDSLYSFVSPGPASLIGSTGQLFNNSGIEFFQGTLYGALDLEGSTDFLFGSFDLSSGAFTTLATVSGHRGGSVGFVAVPGPGVLALMGVGALAGLRRRRA